MINEIIKKNAVSYGVLTGIGSVLITTLIYVVDLELFTAWWVSLVSATFYIVVAIILLSKTKKELKDVFTFKDAFTTYFICALIGIIISVIFNIILFNIIDPTAKETIKEITIKYMISTLEKFNTPPAAINEAIKNLQENDQFSISGLLKGSLTYIVINSIFGLILAAFFKNKQSSHE
jgi:hypothetical protein